MMIRSNLWRFLALAIFSLSAGACGLLDVSDPTVVEEDDISNPEGVELLRREAVTQLFDAVSNGAWYGALASDEYIAFPSQQKLATGAVWREHLVDLRALRGEDATRLVNAPYESFQTTRLAAGHALNWFQRYGSAAQRPQAGQILTVRGYATVQLAENICSGFALHEVKDGKPVYGPPLTTVQVFERALIDLDSALVYAAESEEHLNFARVTRARALLGLGRFNDAAAAVADVPTAYTFNGVYGANPGKMNRLRIASFSSSDNESVADREGGNGLDFASANDPRVEVNRLGTAHDGVTGIYAPVKYKDTTSPITIASGLEARLIEAEAALRGGDAKWLTILNDLRATQISPAMDPLADPGTPKAREDLLFRERAFWLFGSGHRLGDLRRLVEHYGRTVEEAFPSGQYHVGSRGYTTATSLPFAPTGEEQAKTGVIGCID
jgi:hypothetical protein